MHHFTGEGERLTYIYSCINENGQVIRSNVKASMIVVDEEISQKLKDIEQYIYGKLPE